MNNEKNMTESSGVQGGETPFINPVVHIKWLFKNDTKAYISIRVNNNVKFGVMEWARWLCNMRTTIQKSALEDNKQIFPLITSDIHGEIYVIAMEEVEWAEITDGQAHFTFMF